jgi:GTP cyclohydrolase I
VQIADFIETETQPLGTIVTIKAKHMCMSWRGVEQESWTTTTVARGVFKTDASTKAEFLKNVI